MVAEIESVSPPSHPESQGVRADACGRVWSLGVALKHPDLNVDVKLEEVKQACERTLPLSGSQNDSLRTERHIREEAIHSRLH